MEQGPVPGAGISTEVAFSRRTVRSDLALVSAAAALVFLASGDPTAVSFATLFALCSGALVLWRLYYPLVTLGPDGISARPSPLQKPFVVAWPELEAWADHSGRLALKSLTGEQVLLKLRQLSLREQGRLVSFLSASPVPRDHVLAFSNPARAAARFRWKGWTAVMLVVGIYVLTISILRAP